MKRLVLTLCAATAACSTPTPRQQPTPRPVVTDVGTLTLVGGMGELGGGDAGEPLYVIHAGPWADGGPPRPVVAVITRDTAGDVWMLHRRFGARVAGARVVTAAADAYLRPAVSTGHIDSDGFQGHFPTDSTDDDRFVLIARSDGPPSARVVGTVSPKRRAARILPDFAGVTVLAVRVGAVAPEIAAAPLGVTVTCGDDARAHLEAEVGRAGLGPIAWGQPGATVTCAQDGFIVAADRRLLRTPFWAPRQLEVGSAGEVVALLAAARGELDRALVALPSGASPLVRAALALEAGWLFDVHVVLDGVQTPAASLLRAGAAYEVGDYAAALAALDGPDWDPGEETTRRHLARAAVLLGKGDAGEAKAGLTRAAQSAPDGNRSLLLGLAELHLATGDFEGFAVTLAASRGDSGPDGGSTPDQEALTSRYTGLVLQSQGRLDDAIELYLSAAATYADSGDLRSAAQALLRVAELKVSASRDAAAELEQARRFAIDAHDDELLGQVSLDELTCFAEKNAAVDAPDGGTERLRAAEAANLRADRLDRVAVARRYGLLLLPSAADLSTKKRAVQDALNAALAAPDLEEITLLLSLLAQLDAAGFSFDAANRDIDLAIGFARAVGDADLVQVLEAEKRTFQ